MTPEQEAVVAAVLEGRTRDLSGLLKVVPDAQRRALLPELKRIQRSLSAPTRDLWVGLNASRMLQAVLVAGAACNTGAAAAAQWIASSDPTSVAPAWTDLLLDALAGRDPEWLGAVAHRLAERRAVVEGMYECVDGLVRLSGCAVPTTEAFVRTWLSKQSRWIERGTLTDLLRADPFTPVLVPRMFEIPSIGWRFNHQRAGLGWTDAVCRLTREGFFERDIMLDACVARLLRGEQAVHLRGFLDLLDAFQPTEDELVERATDWVRLGCDAPSAVATWAQEILRQLVKVERLETALLVEASQGMLFRTEKKLLRGQLTLLDKAVRQDNLAAPELLTAVANAFGHEDPDIQERALKLAVRHVSLVNASVRAELAAATGPLPPTLRSRAAAVFGAPSELSDEEPYVEILPTVPQPQRISPPPATVEELVEEVGALLADRTVSVAHFERTLDGLVRHAHRDHDALAEALRPMVRRNYAWIEEQQFRQSALGFDFLVAVVIGSVTAPPSDSTLTLSGPRRISDHPCSHAVFDSVTQARLREVALSLLAGTLPPFLLATPDTAAGGLNPAVLLERLREYQQLGVRAGSCDFEQALLRVRPDTEHAAAPAVLGTPEGDRLAEWHSSGGLPAPAPRRIVIAEGAVPRTLVAVNEQPVLHDFVSPAFRRLGRQDPCHHWWAADAPRWLATVPGQREFTAAHMLPALSRSTYNETRGIARHLPLLAEADGPAGLAVHLALAYGLGARHTDDRLASVDALLTLAARAHLDAALLGRELGELVSTGAVIPSRLNDSMRTAARTGAYRTVWSVLCAMLPGILRSGEKPRGLGNLFALASECVERCGGRADIPGLDGLVARGGSTPLVKQARRLREALV
ncbi:DUF6493 family protein [Streptomyces griseorubiginosus]|uniref:DUF6493 family protein n=1 Tax=Streptomyces griseorubiginosus TaxID=67304 RepID=UPI0036EFB143